MGEVVVHPRAFSRALEPDASDELVRSIAEILVPNPRSKNLDRFIAEGQRLTGNIDDWELVEEWDPSHYQIRWYFQRRSK